MGYIMDLRKHIGHDPLIGIGATTLVFNAKNELLLNLRADTNTWGIPGGSIHNIGIYRSGSRYNCF